jgi:hypothetical protein
MKTTTIDLPLSMEAKDEKRIYDLLLACGLISTAHIGNTKINDECQKHSLLHEGVRDKLALPLFES